MPTSVCGLERAWRSLQRDLASWPVGGRDRAAYIIAILLDSCTVASYPGAAEALSSAILIVTKRAGHPDMYTWHDVDAIFARAIRIARRRAEETTT